MTYLQLYRKIELGKKIHEDDYIGCGSCPYAVMGEECYSKLWNDIADLESALNDLGELPEN